MASWALLQIIKNEHFIINTLLLLEEEVEDLWCQIQHIALFCVKLRNPELNSDESGIISLLNWGRIWSVKMGGLISRLGQIYEKCSRGSPPEWNIIIHFPWSDAFSNGCIIGEPFFGTTMHNTLRRRGPKKRIKAFSGRKLQGGIVVGLVFVV